MLLAAAVAPLLECHFFRPRCLQQLERPVPLAAHLEATEVVVLLSQLWLPWTVLASLVATPSALMQEAALVRSQQPPAVLLPGAAQLVQAMLRARPRVGQVELV